MTVSTAYVLAAGLGTRLRPLTHEVCKPLVEVCGTPLVELVLHLLEQAGVTRVAINSHWLHPQLPARLGTSWRGLSLAYTHEPDVLGTGGGLRGLAAVLPAPPGEKVLVMNADALIDIDLAALLAADHAPERQGALATLVLKSVDDVKAYGAIGTRATPAGDRIVDFAGRARTGDVERERMFCGVHLVDPKAFDVLPAVTVVDGVARGPLSGINDEGYPVWMKRGAALYAFDTSGTFCDVGTPERLLEANLAVLDGSWSSAHLAPFARFAPSDAGGYLHASARVDGVALASLVDEGAVVERGAAVHGSVVGKRAVVKSGARVVRSVVMSGAVVAGDVVDSVVSTSCLMGPLTPAPRRTQRSRALG